MYPNFQISAEDGLPRQICTKCYDALNFIYNFRETSLTSQIKLLNQRVADNDVILIDREEPIEKINKLAMKFVRTVSSGKTNTKAYRKRNLEKRLILDTDTGDEEENKMTGTQVSNELQNVNQITPADERIVVSDKRYRLTKLPCDVCGKMYDSTRLKYHLNRHNGKKRKNVVID